MRISNQKIYNEEISQKELKINKPIITPRSVPSSSSQGTKPELVSDVNATPAKQEAKFSLSTLNGKEMKEDMKQSLIADKSGLVNEEQMQVAVVSTLLSQISEKASIAFVKEFSSLVAKGDAVEDSVKTALKSLVTKGELSEVDAKVINGISFRASQLDKNLEMLFDGKGGANDMTIAVDPVEIAIEKASKVISDMKSGSLKFDERSLEAPSNVKETISNGTATGASASGDSSLVSATGSSVNAGGGFLWKPSSDNNSKLVVLFPPSISGSIQSAGLYTSVPPTSENMIESGRFSGVGNGARTHFRFSKSGGQYSDGIYAVGILKDGSYVSYKISDTSSRQESKIGK